MTHLLPVTQLKNLDFEELQMRLGALDPMMEREIEELRQRYTAKRQPILDAMDAKKRRQQNFWVIPPVTFIPWSGTLKAPKKHKTYVLMTWRNQDDPTVFIWSRLLFWHSGLWLKRDASSFILAPGILTNRPCFYTVSRCCSFDLNLNLVSAVL